MPRTSLPPTPAPSGDLPGKNDAVLPTSASAFDLPPPAISQSRHGSWSANKPLQPASRSPNFSLPPPPTRSRTIIQMKPKTQQAETKEKRAPPSGSRHTAKKAPASTAAGGKKMPTSTSVAGKKIARKTAHSVIERRRRSKMNEEFGVLKSLIPACTDQDMHKLAILQASIDYLRYLEKCISDLKVANQALSTPLIQPLPPSARIDRSLADSDEGDGDEDENGDEDTAMGEATTCMAEFSPALSADLPTSGSVLTSPHSILASPVLDIRRTSLSSACSALAKLPSSALDMQRACKQETSSQQGHQPQRYQNTASSNGSRFSSISTFSALPLSASTSPSVLPSNKEQDDEATSALLMLNRDRRASKTIGGSHGGRGMSVKDLLSA